MIAQRPTPDLIGSYWTLAAGAHPWTSQEYCPYSLPERAAAAATSGFRGMGFWHTDLKHLRTAHSFREMKATLNSHGIIHVEVEFLLDWFMTGERRAQSDEMRCFLLDAAEGLGASHLKVGDFFNEQCTLDRMVECFAELCRQGRERGINVLYEVTPRPFSRINTIEEALMLIRQADAPNGGLMLDLWHLVRMGITPDDLRRNLGPSDLIRAELNDGSMTPPEDIVDATVNHRMFVGEGEFDIHGFLSSMRDVGYAGPYGVEVLDANVRDWPLESVARHAFETTVRVFQGPDSQMDAGYAEVRS